jgi:hypothetical protein
MNLSEIEIPEWSTRMFNIAKSRLDSGLQMIPSVIAKAFDQQVYIDQRFIEYEVVKTAQMLYDAYGQYSLNDWINAFLVQMQWRIVQEKTCPIGYKLDETTRYCVQVSDNIYDPNDPPTTNPINSNISKFLVFGIIGILLFAYGRIGEKK